MKKRVVILGSTGSIGVNTLNVIKKLSGQFEVVGLTAYNNIKLIERQIREFSPSFVAVPKQKVSFLQSGITGKRPRILAVEEDLEFLVSLPLVDIVVIGMRGSSALKPFLSAVSSGKIVAPANKEALVIAGEFIMKEAGRKNATVIPVDSEQSAIYQCLRGQNRNELKKIYLTASGGALLNVSKRRFKRLTKSQILDHPRWKMGQKITVDSATLMNKGFEVLEAKHLFGLQIHEIEVIIHPEAIVHSMVEFIDGSVMAQLGVPDMRLPIQYALTFPGRIATGLKKLDFTRINRLNFLTPDRQKFPSLSLAFYVGKKAGTLPSVLNAADEVAVEEFLKEKIGFDSIYKVVEKVVLKHKIIKAPRLDEILSADRWAREEAKRLLEK